MEAPAGTTLGEVTIAELRLAARNHGMPLEALRYPITPVGLHYLLIHYDIPAVDPAAWRLEVDGAVGQPLSLSLADLRAMPAVTRPVTLECAGNGRALLEPRPVSQPWLTEAVGTGRVDGRAAAARARARRPGATTPSRSSSPASTAASRAASSRPTSAASRSPRRWATTRCSRTSSTARRCPPSTASRCGW